MPLETGGVKRFRFGGGGQDGWPKVGSSIT
jgi:hypothetical protein